MCDDGAAPARRLWTDKLRDLKDVDLSGFRLPGQIADLRKLWPVSGNVVELSDQDNNSQGVLSNLVLKLEVLFQSYKDIKPGGRFLHPKNGS